MSGISFPKSYTSAASINATVVKASAGCVHTISAINVSNSLRYIKFYDQNTTPNPAADSANHVYTVPVPASSNGAGQVISFPKGMRFSKGIAFTITTSPSATDATVVGANEVFNNLTWE